jgi:L-fuconolactonase
VTAAGAPVPGRRPAGAPVIDSHQHFWDLSAHGQPWLASDPVLAPLLRNFTLADLAPLAAAAGVTASVVVQTVEESWETPELLALAAGPGLVAGVVGWADLTAPDVADALARLRGLPGGERLSGIRHPVLIEPDADWLARPDVLRGLAAVAAAGLAYDVVGEPRHLPAAVTAARRLPELRFVLDHLGNPDVSPTASPDASRPWATAFAEFAALENTTAKLSGILGVPPPPGTLAHIRPYYELALHTFGPNRLMFGSDWPPCTLDATYAQVCAAARALTAGLSEPEQRAIFSGTATRTYHLPWRARPVTRTASRTHFSLLPQTPADIPRTARAEAEAAGRRWRRAGCTPRAAVNWQTAF